MKTNITTLFLSLFALNIAVSQSLPVRNIQVDLNKIQGQKSTVYTECIGAGRANEGLRADWQQQLSMVQQEIGFKYIRFHGLLHDDMMVYSEGKDGNPIYIIDNRVNMNDISWLKNLTYL